VAGELEGRVKVVEGDITTLQVDAVVNSTDPRLSGSGGVDRAIQRAAGDSLRLELDRLGGCPVGEARPTFGHALPATYILHTAAPPWDGDGATVSDTLRGCYRAALALAAERDLDAVAFPVLGTGGLGYPSSFAAEVAVDAVLEWLRDHDHPTRVVLCALQPGDARSLRESLRSRLGEFPPAPKGTTPAPSATPTPNPADDDLCADRFLRALGVDLSGTPRVGGVALRSRLGQGGMGGVYLGDHPRLGIPVAVKILHPDMLEGPGDLVERFLREAPLAARVDSPHLVRVLDVDRDGDAHYMLLEYVRGPSAGDLLHRALRAGRPGLPEREALELTRAAARGLAAAHAADIVHRDVKPENILVPEEADGTPGLARAKLADLGLGKLLGEASGTTTRTGAIMGTPAYMAPEQAQAFKHASFPADVFGLGASLYALLSGDGPFPGSPVEALTRCLAGKIEPLERRRPGLAADTLEVVRRCLAIDPGERPAQGQELLEALDAAMDALPPPDPRTAKETLANLDHDGKAPLPKDPRPGGPETIATEPDADEG
jgi:O-acetyl-ADP-ribose deacetylase (regulator of RNase III)